MNLWIDTRADRLVAAIGEVDCLLLNDAEMRMLTGEPNLTTPAAPTRRSAPSVVVAKRGEYGAMLFSPDRVRHPALPLEEVADPTGAGDSFAGGFLGYLDSLDGRAHATTSSGGRWSTARRWRASTSRTSGRAGPRRLERPRSTPA